MSTQHLEIEDKFDVDDAVQWIDLDSLPGVLGVGEPQVSTLEAQYYDTGQLALARAGITLRRRTGGSDAGWHLKLPSGSGGRTEHAEPIDSTDEQVPEQLVELVRAWVRDRDLRQVATLRTNRTTYALLGESSAVLAEAADDLVTAETAGSGERAGWREWEIELIDGDPDLLSAAGQLMRAAGATPSPWPSKLSRVLGGQLADGPQRPTFDKFGPRSRAGDVVQAHVVEQVDAILTRDWQARRDEPDGVHKMRVGTRRLRSALATFRPLLDRAVTDPLRNELKWIAGELGGARDAEVLRMRLLAELAHEPDDLVLGPISARIEAELRADHRIAHDALVQALTSERYYRLLDRLDELAVAPPFTEVANGRADKVLRKRVRKSFNRVEQLVSSGPGAVGLAGGDVARDEWYHEIRKASKRLRYAAESVQPAFGADAASLAEAAERLQEVLGEHQDSVVARAALRDLGARIHLDGDNAFTIGRLHALEQTRGDDAIVEFEPAWAALSDKKVIGWL